jgi:menaquinone-dependent protoporphyrinogen oxidase
MTRILVVYGTSYGQTGRIARRIAGEMEKQGYAVVTYRGNELPADLSLDQFDAFLICASLISGKYQEYIRSFVRLNVSRLNQRPSAFVAVSGTAARSAQLAREHATAFLTAIGWAPALVEVFGGAMAFSQYGFVLRLIMKMISRRNGGPTDTSRDYEMTDWAAVDRFAVRLADALPSPAVA